MTDYGWEIILFPLTSFLPSLFTLLPLPILSLTNLPISSSHVPLYANVCLCCFFFCLLCSFSTPGGVSETPQLFSHWDFF
ncbi:MAG: hypothetical protein J3R72DRAFT_434061, partial [Linnemannia gamsii]